MNVKLKEKIKKLLRWKINFLSKFCFKKFNFFSSYKNLNCDWFCCNVFLKFPNEVAKPGEIIAFKGFW